MTENVYTLNGSSVNMSTRVPRVASRFVFEDKHRVGTWVADKVGQESSWGDYYAMGAEVNGELAAGIVFNNFTDSSAACHMAVSKPTKLFPRLIDHGYLYAFHTCNLLRLTALVLASNEKSLNILKHIGFEDECVMRKAGTGGEDTKVLVLWPENYTRLKKHG